MSIKTRCGYALVLVMFLASVLIAAVAGLYAHVKYFTHEIWLQDVEYTKGYYAALAGLRYASILLRSPSSLQFDANHNYNVTGTELGGNFFNDVKGGDPATLVVTITEITQGSDAGKYSVSATYSR